MMPVYLEKTYSLPNEPLLAYSILKIMESAAREHMEKLDLARETMLEHYGAIWMVARTFLSFSAPALPGHSLTVRTWLRPMELGMIFRDFDFFQNGIYIGEAVQTWVLVDSVRRRMILMNHVESLHHYPSPAAVKTRYPARIKTPVMLFDAPPLSPTHDTVDENGHINNVSYVPLALHGLSIDHIQTLQLNYHQECFAGQTLSRKQRRDGKQLFVQLYSPQGDAAFALLADTF